MVSASTTPSWIRNDRQRQRWEALSESKRSALLERYNAGGLSRESVVVAFTTGGYVASNEEQQRALRQTQSIIAGKAPSERRPTVGPISREEWRARGLGRYPEELLRGKPMAAIPEPKIFTKEETAARKARVLIEAEAERPMAAPEPGRVIKALPATATYLDAQGRPIKTTVLGKPSTRIIGVSKEDQAAYEAAKTKAYQATLGFGGFGEMQRVAEKKENMTTYLTNEAARIQKLADKAKTPEQVANVNAQIERYNKQTAEFMGLQAGERKGAVQISRQIEERRPPREEIDLSAPEYMVSTEAFREAGEALRAGDIDRMVETFGVGVSKIPIELADIGEEAVGGLLPDSKEAKAIGRFAGSAVGGVATAIPSGAYLGMEIGKSVRDVGLIGTAALAPAAAITYGVGAGTYAMQYPVETAGLLAGQAALFGWLTPKGKLTTIQRSLVRPGEMIPIKQTLTQIRSGMGVKPLAVAKTTYPAMKAALAQISKQPMPSYSQILAGTTTKLAVAGKPLIETVRVGAYTRGMGILSKKAVVGLEQVKTGAGVRVLGKYGVGLSKSELGKLSVIKVTEGIGHVPKSSIAGLKAVTGKSLGAAELTRSSIMLRAQLYGTPTQLAFKLGKPTIPKGGIGIIAGTDMVKQSAAKDIQAAMKQIKPTTKPSIPMQDVGAGFSAKQMQMTIPKTVTISKSIIKQATRPAGITSMVTSTGVTIPKMAPILLPKSASIQQQITIPKQEMRKAIIPMVIPKMEIGTITTTDTKRRTSIVPLVTPTTLTGTITTPDTRRILVPTTVKMPKLEFKQRPDTRRRMAPAVIPSTITMGITTPYVGFPSPSVSVPDSGFNIPLLPIAWGGGGIGGRRRGRKGKKPRQPRRYTPSLTAGLIGKVGLPSKELFTGVEIRPLVGKKKSRRRKKK